MRRTLSNSLLSKANHSKFFFRDTVLLSSSYKFVQTSHPIYSHQAKFNFFATSLISNIVLYQPCHLNQATHVPPFLHCFGTLSQMNKQCDFEEAFASSRTTEDLMAAFKALEITFSENDKKLGLACLKVGEILLMNFSEELEKALSFVVRALDILGKIDGEGSLPLLKALRLVGAISCKMKRFDESLESLETACQILGSLEENGFSGKEFDSEKISIQIEIANTKNVMGRRWEALSNLRKALQMRILILEPDSLELALACKDVGEAYVGVLEFSEALPLCSKALEIFESKLGRYCEEAVHIRQLLGSIYVGLGENNQALVQNELCQEILLTFNQETELLNMKIEAANIHVNLGGKGEAMNILKEVIQKAGKESETRAFALISMAKIMFLEERFGDSKASLNMSCDILNKVNSTSFQKAAEAFLEISMLYEMMNEFETAISLMKRALTLLEKNSPEQFMMGSIFARMGWLLLLLDRAQEAVPTLESAITKLKESFGPRHFGLGLVYKHLGEAYLEIDNAQSALQVLLQAKNIIEASFGQQHEDSINTCQYIANAYGVLGKYDQAMKWQQEVKNRWEGKGPDAREDFNEACRLLYQLKRKAEGSLSAVFPANSLPLILTQKGAS